MLLVKLRGVIRIAMSVAALNVVRERVAALSSQMGHSVRLVAVSKTKPIEDLMEIYGAGQRHFGENYVQEVIEKAPMMPDDINWHFIGHLQSNKAKALVHGVPNLFMVECIDSPKVATALQKAIDGLPEARARVQPLKVLVQINTSGEESKNGVAAQDVMPLVNHIMGNCPQLQLEGLMTIGRLGDASASEECFQALREVREQVQAGLSEQGHEELAGRLELSMGMSADYELAIGCGSTSVRVGSTIFGARNYSNAKK